jgi:PleD family two-component response regulator
MPETSQIIALHQNPIRILVIEDNGEDFVLLSGIVAQAPHHRYQIDLASDWPAARDKLKQNDFDVVLADYYLGADSAVDVITGIKEEGLDVPVVVLTAYANLDADLKAMEVGAYDYLDKNTISPEIFDRCIRYVMARANAEERIRRAAFFDELTGLANRRYLFEKIGSAFERAKRRESEVSVLLVDLNDFKEINDGYGHDSGDAVLAEVGRRLQGAVRKTDTAARWGGDEFIIVLEDFKNAAMPTWSPKR